MSTALVADTGCWVPQCLDGAGTESSREAHLRSGDLMLDASFFEIRYLKLPSIMHLACSSFFSVSTPLDGGNMQSC